MKEVYDLKDDEITEAFERPDVPRSVNRLFDFLQDNSNLITKAGGMGHVATGLDKYKLAELARGYGLNIYSWMFAVRVFEKHLIRQHNEKEK